MPSPSRDTLCLCEGHTLSLRDKLVELALLYRSGEPDRGVALCDEAAAYAEKIIAALKPLRAKYAARVQAGKAVA